MVENDLYRIVFTNHGAQAKSWILKKYKDEKGQPLDLVNPARPASDFLWASTPTTRPCATRSILRCTSATPSGSVTAPGELTFEYSDGAVSVRKTFASITPT